MVLKTRDAAMMAVRFLEAELARAHSDAQRQVIERELIAALADEENAKEAAYHIDFHFGESPRWMIIHDLRMESGGRTALIDHLVIGRRCEMHVVNSKNLKTKVRYRNGGWERMQGETWSGFPCPIEQNRSHIEVLREIIDRGNLSPNQPGVPLVTFKNVVVLNPSCSIAGRLPQDVDVWRMDHMPKETWEDDSNMLSDATVVSPGTAERFARALVALHRPWQAELTAPATGAKPKPGSTKGSPYRGGVATMAKE